MFVCLHSSNDYIISFVGDYDSGKGYYLKDVIKQEIKSSKKSEGLTVHCS